MANIDMKTLTIGENTYIVIDAGARTLIGDLSNLDTTAKNNLVAAINEAFNSGSGGTSDYSDLTNKPQINGNTLAGNKTAEQLGLGTYSMPSGGIPSTDFASAVQDALALAILAYQKPRAGIPATDLDSAVQTSLGKADTALQSVPSTYRTAEAQDVIDATKADKVTVLQDTRTGAVTQQIDSGVVCNFTGALTSLTISLSPGDELEQYHFTFESGSTPPTLTLPSDVEMPSGFQVEANKHYEVSILTVDGQNYYGVAQSW